MVQPTTTDQAPWTVGMRCRHPWSVRGLAMLCLAASSLGAISNVSGDPATVPVSRSAIESLVRARSLPQSPDWAFHGKPLAEREEMHRSLLLGRTDGMVRTAGECLRRIASARVVLIGDNHLLDAIRKSARRLLEAASSALPGGMPRGQFAMEALPRDRAMNVDGTEPSARSALSHISETWPWPIGGYASLLHQVKSLRWSIGGLGPPAPPTFQRGPTYDMEGPYGRAGTLADRTGYREGLDQAILRAVQAQAASREAPPLWIFAGMGHFLENPKFLNELRALEPSLVFVLTPEPAWELALMSSGSASLGAWLEVSPGILRCPFGLEEMATEPVRKEKGERADTEWFGILEGLRSGELSRRRQAAETLRNGDGFSDQGGEVLFALQDQDADVRRVVARALNWDWRADQGVVEALIARLDDSSEPVRVASLDTLRHLRPDDPMVADVFRQVIRVARSPAEVESAVLALASTLADPGTVPTLLARTIVAGRTSDYLRLRALHVLLRYGVAGASAVPIVAAALPQLSAEERALANQFISLARPAEPDNKQKERSATARMNYLVSVIWDYLNAHRKLPLTLEDLAATSADFPQPFLKSIPKDPWGRDHLYRVDPKLPHGFSLRSAGADGLPQTADDVGWSGE